MALIFGQDLDAMIEARNSAEWEEINEEPELDTEDVAEELTDALDDLLQCMKHIGTAANTAKGFPVWDDLMELFDGLEPYQTDVETLRDRIKKGVA